MVLFDQDGIYLDISVDITSNSSSDFHDLAWPTKSGWSMDKTYAEMNMNLLFTVIYIHIIFSGNICIHSLLSWVVYTNMFPWELYDPSKMICILYLSCSAWYICICSPKECCYIFTRPKAEGKYNNIPKGTYTYIAYRA